MTCFLPIYLERQNFWKIISNSSNFYNYQAGAPRTSGSTCTTTALSSLWLRAEWGLLAGLSLPRVLRLGLNTAEKWIPLRISIQWEIPKVCVQTVEIGRFRRNRSYRASYCGSTSNLERERSLVTPMCRPSTPLGSTAPGTRRPLAGPPEQSKGETWLFIFSG